MIRIVKTISSEIAEGLRRIKVQRLGKSDIQTPFQGNPAGIDSQPLPGLKAIHAQTGEKGEPVIIGYINEELLAQDGEIRVFSIDSDGALKAYVHAKNDGILEVNGNADFMVRYSALETAYNQLKDDFDSFVSTYNTHTHPVPGITAGAASATASVTTATGSPSTGDITPSKIDNVKTN